MTLIAFILNRTTVDDFVSSIVFFYFCKRGQLQRDH